MYFIIYVTFIVKALVGSVGIIIVSLMQIFKKEICRLML
jgi:hypothetical protein